MMLSSPARPARTLVVLGLACVANASWELPAASAVPNLPSNTWAYASPESSWRYMPVAQQPDAVQPYVETKEPQFREYTGIALGDGLVYYFGGGHSGYPGNDVETYSLQTNTWRQSYKPNVPPAGDPVYGSGGSPYSWVDPATGEVRPYTIHGYARTSYYPLLHQYVCTAAYCKSVVYDSGSGEWVCNDPDEGNGNRKGELIAFDPNTNRWTLLAPMPIKGILTQYDSGLGGILAIEGGSIWLFRNGAWSQYDSQSGVNLSGEGGSGSVYIPELQSHMIAVLPQGGCCGDYVQGRLYMYNSGQKTLREITSAPSEVTSQLAPEGNFVMAYDSRHQRVVALCAEDKSLSGSSPVHTWIYNPFSDTWSTLPVSPTSPLLPGFSAISRLPLQYDPAQNVFVLMAKRYNGSFQTWYYRYVQDSTAPDTFAPADTGDLRGR